MIITTNLGIVTAVEMAISMPKIMSKPLTMLKPRIKIKPLINKINPRIKIKVFENKLKIPNSQKHTAIKISKTPKTFMNIGFLKYNNFKNICPCSSTWTERQHPKL